MPFSEHNPPIAHIDLKSPNIFITSMVLTETCAKIADFGTAQLVTEPILCSKVDNPTWQGEAFHLHAIYIFNST